MKNILDALHNKGLVTLHHDEQGRAIYTLAPHVVARTSINARSTN